VQDVAARLRGARLVTLTGTGGIGKTRLSLEVASAVAAEFGDGVALAELGPLADDDLVVRCVADACGVREQFLRPLIETLRAALGDRSLLLVLDNCEHVLASCVTLVDQVLRTSPGVRILATSREPLRIAGEVVWRVPPLAVPDLTRPVTSETLESHDATRLFIERALALGARLTFGERQNRAIAEVCSRLDGVPLAIELAAARTPMFSVEQIALRLDDAVGLLTNGSRAAPARHQTLRAAIDWSYGLLSEPERTLLERLAVFAGGFSLDAAERVLADRTFEVVEVLSRLVDRSLVVAEPDENGEVRYDQQEVLRQFGLERLEERGSGAVEALRQRHAEFFLDLVEHAEAVGLGEARRTWLDRVERELDNFRAARRWFVGRADGERAQRLCASLYRLLVYRGHASEGRAALLEALALDGAPPATRARALHFLGSLAWTQGDFTAASAYQREALHLRRQIGDENGMVWSLAALGIAATMTGDLAMGEILLDEARETGRAGADRYVYGLSLSLSALTQYLGGNREAARRFAHEALDEADRNGFASIRCMALTTIGTLHYRDGDLATATRVLERALETAEAVGEVFLIVRAALSLALVAADAGETRRARSLLAEGVSLAQQMGNRHSVAQALEGTAGFAALQGRAEDALRMAEAAAAIRAALGAPLSPTERQLLERRLGPLEGQRAALGEGGTWSLDVAAARALELLEQC
jgi:non-specific serine/threonine protein kinase